MPLLNSDQMSYIYSYDRDKEPAINFPMTPQKSFEDIVAKDRNCWYIGINGFFSVYHIHKFIPDNILTDIQTGSTFLLVCMEYEPFTEVVRVLYEELVIKLNIPAEKIIFVGGGDGFYEEVIKCSKEFNQNEIKTVSLTIGETNMHIAQRTIKPRRPRTYKKKFLNLNRRWRLHRPMLVGLLKSLNLLDYGYVSLAHADDNLNWSDVWDEIINLHDEHPCEESLYLLSSHKEDILNMPPLYVDRKDLTVSLCQVKESILEFYEQTYFSLVTETNYFSGTRHLTEKIFKPVIYRHPFIVLSRPNTLTLFKSFGYKTFSPFFNEDYDLEENPCKRIMMIVSEVERLCKLSDAEWSTMIVELDKICDYNFSVLQSKRAFKDYLIFHN